MMSPARQDATSRLAECHVMRTQTTAKPHRRPLHAANGLMPPPCPLLPFSSSIRDISPGRTWPDGGSHDPPLPQSPSSYASAAPLEPIAMKIAPPGHKPIAEIPGSTGVHIPWMLVSGAHGRPTLPIKIAMDREWALGTPGVRLQRQNGTCDCMLECKRGTASATALRRRRATRASRRGPSDASHTARPPLTHH